MACGREERSDCCDSKTKYDQYGECIDESFEYTRNEEENDRTRDAGTEYGGAPYLFVFPSGETSLRLIYLNLELTTESDLQPTLDNMSSVEDRTWNWVEESGDPESQGAYGSGANGRERLADEQVLLDEDPAIPEQSANDDKKSEGGRSVRTASSRLSSASARRERAAIRMKKVKEDAAIKMRMLEEKEKMLMLENEQLAAIEEEMVEDEFEDGSSQSGIRSPLSE
ncbi:hypothetical protein CAPTEDRAFT_188380, partial [Capitella teleta]